MLHALASVSVDMTPRAQPDWPAGSGLVDELGAYFDTRGRLRPAALELGPESAKTEVGRAQLIEELAVASELAQHAMAVNTQRNYGGHVRAWQSWCRSRGVPVLPAVPADLSRHLAGYAVAFAQDERAVRDDDGRLTASVAAVTVQLRLAAIDKLHELAGLTRPGGDVEVRRVMAGIRRTFGVRPVHAKAALDLARLRPVLAVARRMPDDVSRRDLVILLRAHTGTTPGQIVRLQWSDVRLRDHEVELTFPADRRGGARHSVLVPAVDEAALCLVAALSERRGSVTDLRAPVVASGAGAALTRAGAHKMLMGVPVLAETTRTAGRRALLAALSSGDLHRQTKPLRDACLLLTGFFAALRRSNLCALTWRDLRRSGPEWELLLARSKTDQEGRGRTLVLPVVGEPQLCPAAAMSAWWAHVAALIGGDPLRLTPDAPVFPAVDRHGNVQMRDGRASHLAGTSVNELVQALVIQAGLTAEPAEGGRNPYGAHSLRAGFVTEAFSGNKLTMIEVAEVTGHVSFRELRGYLRRTTMLESSPVRKLLIPTIAA